MNPRYPRLPINVLALAGGSLAKRSIRASVSRSVSVHVGLGAPEKTSSSTSAWPNMHSLWGVFGDNPASIRVATNIDTVAQTMTKTCRALKAIDNQDLGYVRRKIVLVK